MAGTVASPATATFSGRNGDLVFEIGRSTTLDPMGETCSTPNCSDGRLYEFDLRRRKRAELRTCQAVECHDGSPAVGPRGRSLAFTRVDYGDPESEELATSRHYIGISRRDGTGVRLIEVPAVDPTFSPDGQRLVYTHRVNFVSNLHVLDRFSGQRQRLTHRGGSRPDWSSRNRIVFARAPRSRRFSSKRDLYTVRPDGSGLKRLTRNGRAGSPSWAPDGRRIVYSEFGRGLYTVGADGTHRRRLRAGDDSSPVWSPDGKRIAFVNGPRIWVMRSDGAGARIVHVVRGTGSRSPVGRLSWSPATR